MRRGTRELEARPNGLTLAFRKNSFAYPALREMGLEAQGRRSRVRPDMRIVVTDDFESFPTGSMERT
jgi:hypothetical protein